MDEDRTNAEPGLRRLAAVQARDAALALVSRVNRWMISAAVLVAAGLTALTAHAFHARAATTTPSTSQSSPAPAAPAPSSTGNTGNTGNTGSTGNTGNTGNTGVAPPANNPSAAPMPQPVAPVVSGGS